MLKIILGPAYAGQSDMLCKEMVERSAAQPASSFIAIVPEQSTLKMQRDVVKAHPAHAVMNIDIVSFNRLAHKVFDELGYRESDILNDTGKVLVLRKVLEACREDMVVYKSKVHMPGFAAEMKSVVTELKQYAIDDNQLFLMQEAAHNSGNGLLYNKLQDIRLIYHRFSEEIEDRYTTQEEVLDVLARVVSGSGMIKNAHIYMDGFTGFTPIQYKLIEELLRVASDITVTLTLPEDEVSDDPQMYDKFCLSNQTYTRLRQIALNAGSEFKTESAVKKKNIPQVYKYAAGDISSEVIFIAKEILNKVRNEGARFRDFAIICSDMDSYHDVIEEVFDEAGISCFLDYKSRLGENALARYVLAALQAAAERLSYESVFAWLKSGLTDVSYDDICKLENYCLEFGIRGANAWSKDFTKNRKIYSQTEEKYFWDLEAINAVRKEAVTRLPKFYKKCRESEKTAADFSGALLELLINDGIEEKVERMADAFARSGDMSRGKEYEQIYKLVTELIEEISDLMGTEKLDIREYTKLAAGALEEIKVSIIPPSLDAVIVGDLTRTRLEDVKFLFIAGINDGKLPAPAASMGLFTQREREFLKEADFDLAPTALENLCTQNYYIYMLMMKPEDSLYLSYAAMNMAGEQLTPSYILDDLDSFLPGISVEKIETAPEETWRAQAARELADTARELSEQKETAVISEKSQQLMRFFEANEPQVLRQAVSGAFYSNQPLPLDEQTALALYGDKLKASVSRYEKYYECPFKHFMSYGLEIRERPEYEVKAVDIGNIYHSSLERYAQKLKERGLTFRNVSDEDSREITTECIREAAAEMDNEAAAESERNKFLMGRITEVACKTTDVLRDHVKKGQFEPELFEMTFEIDDGDSTVFQGKIDRVDIYDGDDVFVKIIDYKSGQEKFEIKDLYMGIQLQLAAYMGAAIEKVKKKYPDRKVLPGGVYYYLIQDKFVEPGKESDKFQMSGLTNCDFGVADAIDSGARLAGESNIIHVKYKKDGDFDSSSKIANSEEFDHMIAFAKNKISEVSSRLKEGDVRIAPYISGSSNGCKYCVYKDVCKFEPCKWGSDYNDSAEGVDSKDMEKEIYGRI